MKKINKVTFLVAFCLNPVFCFAQTLADTLLEQVSQNIVVYNFRFGLDYELKLSNNVLRDGEPFYRILSPAAGTNLDIQANKIEFNYPKTGLEFYEIIKLRFTFLDNKGSMNIESFAANRKYLVAVNPLVNKLRFISGNFFLSRIAADFELDAERPESFFKYLEVRYYNMGLTKIKFRSFKKGILTFDGFSEELKQEVVISVKRSDYNVTSWKFKHKQKAIMG
jgi:hypothetical protein